MKKIELTKGEFALVDDVDYERVNKHSWYFDHGYAARRYPKKTYMHRFILGDVGNGIVDHINRNKLDNRKENLRVGSMRQNSMNTGIRKNNTSGVTGVCWYKPYSLWSAHIRVHPKQVFLGYFHIFDEAVKARKEAEVKYA